MSDLPWNLWGAIAAAISLLAGLCHYLLEWLHSGSPLVRLNGLGALYLQTKGMYKDALADGLVTDPDEQRRMEKVLFYANSHHHEMLAIVHSDKSFPQNIKHRWNGTCQTITDTEAALNRLLIILARRRSENAQLESYTPGSPATSSSNKGHDQPSSSEAASPIPSTNEGSSPRPNNIPPISTIHIHHPVSHGRATNVNTPGTVAVDLGLPKADYTLAPHPTCPPLSDAHVQNLQNQLSIACSLLQAFNAAVSRPKRPKRHCRGGSGMKKFARHFHRTYASKLLRGAGFPREIAIDPESLRPLQEDATDSDADDYEDWDDTKE
ncbi:hypothetical protein C2E23DRAFT_896022 [Lenzites betulinus]|nr:hypothetical protein C2E23DRAFT_896022 [Lenzites betulinus]